MAIPAKLIGMVKSCTHNAKSKINFKGELSARG